MINTAEKHLVVANNVDNIAVINTDDATYISLKKGNIAEKEYNEINNVISDFKLPVYTTGILASDVVKATKNDKKMDSGVIKFITLVENGHAIIDRTISEELLLEATETVIRG